MLHISSSAEDWTLGGMAGYLQMPERTIQHRLKGESTNFQQIVESVRKERSLRLMQEENSIADIAARLGYSEPRSFYRAFQRWYGTTPQNWEQLTTSELGGE